MKISNRQTKHGSPARGSQARLTLPGAILLLGIGAACGCREPADADQGAQPEAPASEEASLPRYERFGYYLARDRYDESFQIKDIAATGMAGRLTVLAYGFGGIDPSTLTCSTSSEAAPQGTGADDDFNQLKKLKSQFPHLKVVISLGGRTAGELFSDIAATDASRKKFVASCIDLYIKGSAAGIFDGLDIVWQWPASTDKANHALLLQELRRQLDEASGGSRYLLTALLPADPAKIAAGIDTGSIFQAVDFGNVQAYDFHGPWEPTRTYHHAQLSATSSGPTPVSAQLSGDAALMAYVSAGVPRNRLTLGLPLYGYGWTGVCTPGLANGLFQAASGVAAGTPTKAGTAPVKELLRQFAPKQLKRGDQVHDPKDQLSYDPVAIAAYGYNGSTFWSFDDAKIIQGKASYIQEAGLRGAMLWSLDGDDGSLVHVLDSALNAPLAK
jgi:chitinase